MDVDAIKHAADADLIELGLEAKGDIIALRAFCVRLSEQNKSSKDIESYKCSLLNSVKNSNRLGKKGKEKNDNKMCYFGYMIYKHSEKRYVQLRG